MVNMAGRTAWCHGLLSKPDPCDMRALHPEKGKEALDAEEAHQKPEQISSKLRDADAIWPRGCLLAMRSFIAHDDGCPGHGRDNSGTPTAGWRV
jgi:hypothetical protein